LHFKYEQDSIVVKGPDITKYKMDANVWGGAILVYDEMDHKFYQGILMQGTVHGF
jgi:hypothetical protein